MKRTMAMLLTATVILAGCDNAEQQDATPTETSDALAAKSKTSFSSAADPHQAVGVDDSSDLGSSSQDKTEDIEHQATVSDDIATHNLPFADNIVSYFRIKQAEALKACQTSGLALQDTQPEHDCYDKLDTAFIRPRILFENDAIALLTTRNMFGFGEGDLYHVEAISLKRSTLRPLWSALGSEFDIHTEENEILIHYQTTEFGRSMVMKAHIRL